MTESKTAKTTRATKTRSTRRRPSSASKRADALYDELEPGLDGLGLVDVEITRNMLRDYCWIAGQLSVLAEQVDKEGAVITTEEGKMIEHPAVKTIARLMTQKNAYFAKLHRIMNIDAGQEDEFEAFIKGA